MCAGLPAKYYGLCVWYCLCLALLAADLARSDLPTLQFCVGVYLQCCLFEHLHMFLAGGHLHGGAMHLHHIPSTSHIWARGYCSIRPGLRDVGGLHNDVGLRREQQAGLAVTNHVACVLLQ